MLDLILKLLVSPSDQSETGQLAARAHKAIIESRIIEWNFSNRGWRSGHYWNIYNVRYEAMKKNGRYIMGMQETLNRLADETANVFLLTLRLDDGCFYFFINEVKTTVLGCFFIHSSE